MARKKDNNLWYIIGGIIILILLFWIITINTGDDGVVCNSPYIQVGQSCCFDGNNNNICDVDEGVDTTTEPSCGNNFCEENEDCLSCSFDCGECSIENICRQEEIINTVLNSKGVLWMEDLMVTSPGGWKMQWKVFCFDIPLAHSVRGTVEFSDPLWFMINDEEDVNCQTYSYTKDSSYQDCGFDLGFASGSSDLYQSFDFSAIGREKLCLSVSGAKENDIPITYDILIETYGMETICG